MPSVGRVIIYAKDVAKTVAFYEKHFGFTPHVEPGDRLLELVPTNGGVHLLIHSAGKGMKDGQSCVKLVFDVEDVKKFHDRCAKQGLKFGAIHQADGYQFSNAKDPGKNSIQISSRSFRTR